MKSCIASLALATLVLLAAAAPLAAASVRLDQLDLGKMTSGWGKPLPDQAVTGKPLVIGGREFAHGVGTHAESECAVTLDGCGQSFAAQVGVDDNAGNAQAALEFYVYGDGRELWHSGVCHWRDKPRSLHVDLAGVKQLELVVAASGENVNFDHADWADAVFEFAGAAPKMAATAAAAEEAVILTPPAPPQPRINGPLVYGVRPAAPFSYRIPATGHRPMTFAADGLPAGLTLDRDRGILTGSLAQAGTYRTTLRAANDAGKASREFRIVVGKQLALTPPMGWNSWYIHYNRVSDKVLRQAADQMIASGMADYGYQYVNSDDCWNVRVNSKSPVEGGPTRDAHGELLPNKRFPDMQALTAYIHGKGLKAGIYISPGPATCGGYEGSYRHEAQDARTFARWGFDFLKYDWCSYGSVAGGSDLAHLQKPYQLMWNELQKLDRDVVFNLCQYGMGQVWKWGGTVGHSWRTTGDLGLENRGRLPGFYTIGLSNARHWQYAGPGAWNDPDYILIGWVGDAYGMGQGKPTALTPNEQYSYMSMWSLMAAPLIFSGDMAKLDPFTLNVLCNHEVIDVDQDPLGRQGRIVKNTPSEMVFVKELADGSRAVGLFNLGSRAGHVSAGWRELGLSGKQAVRDLWRQKDLDPQSDALDVLVPRHGVALLRLRASSPLPLRERAG